MPEIDPALTHTATAAGGGVAAGIIFVAGKFIVAFVKTWRAESRADRNQTVGEWQKISEAMSEAHSKEISRLEKRIDILSAEVNSVRQANRQHEIRINALVEENHLLRQKLIENGIMQPSSGRIPMPMLADGAGDGV